jgi:hypothetical protein
MLGCRGKRQTLKRLNEWNKWGEVYTPTIEDKGGGTNCLSCCAHFCQVIYNHDGLAEPSGVMSPSHPYYKSLARQSPIKLLYHEVGAAMEVSAHPPSRDSGSLACAACLLPRLETPVTFL